MGTGRAQPESGETGTDAEERVAECEVRAADGNCKSMGFQSVPVSGLGETANHWTAFLCVVDKAVYCLLGPGVS